MGIFAIGALFGRPASADDSSPDAGGRASASSLPSAGSPEIARSNALRATRVAHVDYKALTAGALLLGAGYALALSVPVHRKFSGDSRDLAVPLAGPWLSKVTWPYALDGLLQLGGLAFIVDAYANPVAVLGPSDARLESFRNRDHLLKLCFRF